MIKKHEKTEEMTNGKERMPMLQSVHKVLLASIGAVGLAQDEIEDFVDRLVERGEIAEKDGKKLVREMIDRQKKQGDKAGKEVDKRVEDMFNRMNVPSKTDLETLGAKITALSHKVDELKKTHA